jgi:ribosomal protein S18 acetylase RimI-like enzyme
VHDVDIVADLLADGGSFARTQGFHQWPVRFSNTFLQEPIERGETFLGLLDDKAVATFNLSATDASCWGLDDGTSGYLHRLAVSRTVRGRMPGFSVGGLVLDWAQRYFAELGRPSLRLDTLISNFRLRAWYEAQGFVHQGESQVRPWQSTTEDDTVTIALYQR